MIESDGFCVLKGWMPADHLRLCEDTEAARSLPRSCAQPSSSLWKESVFGRYHRVTFSPEDALSIEEIERPLLPLVRAFFGTTEDGVQREFYRSERQLLTAVPDSDRQLWHSDNRGRGITLLVRSKSSYFGL